MRWAGARACGILWLGSRYHLFEELRLAGVFKRESGHPARECLWRMRAVSRTSFFVFKTSGMYILLLVLQRGKSMDRKADTNSAKKLINISRPHPSIPPEYQERLIRAMQWKQWTLGKKGIVAGCQPSTDQSKDSSSFSIFFTFSFLSLAFSFLDLDDWVSEIQY